MFQNVRRSGSQFKNKLSSKQILVEKNIKIILPFLNKNHNGQIITKFLFKATH